MMKRNAYVGFCCTTIFALMSATTANAELYFRPALSIVVGNVSDHAATDRYCVIIPQRMTLDRATVDECTVFTS